MAQPNTYSSYRLFDNKLSSDLMVWESLEAFVLKSVISTSRLVVFTFPPALKFWVQ